MIERIQWLGHASFRIVGGPVIYIDPWRVSRDSVAADIILITHDHYDHCSPADIEKVSRPHTMIVANAMAASLIERAKVLRPWQVLNIDRACIKAVPAYNSHHPQSFDGLGYIISLDRYDIYYAGDTDVIPEMSMLHPDIAILPIGGRQTMNVAGVVAAVKVLHPRWVIPSHWGTISEGGSMLDVKALGEALGELAELVILPQSH